MRKKNNKQDAEEEEEEEDFKKSTPRRFKGVYYIRKSAVPTYLEGRRSDVFIRRKIGQLHLSLEPPGPDAITTLEAAQKLGLVTTSGLIVGAEEKIGTFGILHPAVIQNFEIGFPASAMEIDLEAFLR